MSLEHFDLSDLLESLKNDVVRKAKQGEIPGHDLSVNARSGIAACSCGWRFYSVEQRSRSGERRGFYQRRSALAGPARNHATLAATRPELFAGRSRAANG